MEQIVEGKEFPIIPLMKKFSFKVIELSCFLLSHLSHVSFISYPTQVSFLLI